MFKNVPFVEIAVTSLVVGLVDFFLPVAPGFGEYFFLPYLVLALFFASYGGYVAGFMSLVASALTVAALYPLALRLLPQTEVPAGYWQGLADEAMAPAAIALVLIYLFGQLRVAHRRQLADTQARLEEVTKQHWNVKQKSEALERVNRELEERVAGQRESLTSLYTQLEKLHTLDVSRCLHVLLETISVFTGARRISVHSYDSASQTLKRAAEWIPEGSPHVAPGIELDGSIEGWVFRNDSTFSVRMLVSLDTLRKMDTGRNILTLPIHVHKRVWGVLNIEDMPFEKYNLYSERILHIILGLAQPALERALEHRRLIASQEVDDDTGLPYVSLFFRQLHDAVAHARESRTTMTVVLLEVMNFDRIISERGMEQAKRLWTTMTEALIKLGEHRADFYHYKQDNQIAAIFPGLDHDGASLFCLETLELMNTQEWTVAGEKTPLEVAIGFASLTGADAGAEQLLEQAETLLDMQKS